MKYLTKSLNAQSSELVKIDESTYAIVSDPVDSADIPLYEVSSSGRKQQRWTYAFFGGICGAVLMYVYMRSNSCEK